MKVYLAGPIRDVLDPITWRRNIAFDLPKGWRALDPTEIELFVEDEDVDRNAHRIVLDDLKAIESCDAVIALISTPSWGTAMEIFYAHQLRIPVIGWNPGNRSLSPWVKVHCDVIVPEFADIKLILQNLLVKT